MLAGGHGRVPPGGDQGPAEEAREQIGAPVFDMGIEASSPDIAAKGLAKAKEEGIDVVIVDTAGRLQIDEQLMGELQATKAATGADETLLVVDAMTGQEARR